MRITLLISLLLLSLQPLQVHAAGKKVTKIFLDAGHGGHDAGAPGAYSHEKDLTLAIVMKLGRLINDSLKGMQIAYRRTTDVYNSPNEIPKIANEEKADLFVCVHINSTPYWTERIQTGTRTIRKRRRRIEVPVYKSIRHHTTTRNGVETLVLGSIRNNEKQKVVGEYGDDIVGESGLLNENDPQTAIIIAQYTKAFLSRSVLLGTHIRDAFADQGRTDLGVKQQSLAVLAGSYMPGVLVECGFITNPDEENYMNSEKGQWEIATAIFRGIKAYKQEVER